MRRPSAIPALAHDRRPTSEIGQELVITQLVVEAVAILVVPAATGKDEFLRGGGVELRDLAGPLAGEPETFQRHRVSQQAGAGGVPAGITVIIRLRRPQMIETAIPLAGEVVIPLAEFLHPRARGVRSGKRDAGHGPKDVEIISRVAAIAFRAVRAEAHVREELGALGFIHQVEQHGGHPALAVVFVGLHPRRVVTVGNASLADIEPQQPQRCARWQGKPWGR